LSQQTVPGTRTNSGHGAGSSVVPYLALHPMGFSVPPRLRLERWALTPPFHPYPACHFKLKFQARRFVFCGTVRRDASRHRLPRVSRNPPSCVGNYRLRGIAPFGVRTFLPPRNYSRERFSAFPKSTLIYGKNVRTQVDCKFPDQSATARSMSRL